MVETKDNYNEIVLNMEATRIGRKRLGLNDNQESQYDLL